jgi:hypothetical protein
MVRSTSAVTVLPGCASASCTRWSNSSFETAPAIARSKMERASGRTPAVLAEDTAANPRFAVDPRVAAFLVAHAESRLVDAGRVDSAVRAHQDRGERDQEQASDDELPAPPNTFRRRLVRGVDTGDRAGANSHWGAACVP